MPILMLHSVPLDLVISSEGSLGASELNPQINLPLSAESNALTSTTTYYTT
jgi:hypothetical protein